MSSAVNKSSKRFVPKIGSRGSSIRAPVRRNTRRSFSVPNRADSNALQSLTETQATTEGPTQDSQHPVAQEQRTRAEILGLSTDEIAEGSGSAIDDTADDTQQVALNKTSTTERLSRGSKEPRESVEGAVLKDPAPASVSATVPVDELNVTTPNIQGTQSTQTTLVENETSQTPQVSANATTQSTQMDPSQGKHIEISRTQIPQISEPNENQPEGPPSQDSFHMTSKAQMKPNIASFAHQQSIQRPPPPVQPVSQQPVRLSNLTAPRRPPAISKRPVTRAESSTGTARNAMPNTSRTAKPSVPSSRPEAPPGCQIVDPEDLRDLKREERRRREAWENAQIKLMRELFIDKEHKRLMEEESYDETTSMRVAHSTSETLTFNALKQAVMSELKEYKEKMEKEKAKEIELQAKQKPGTKTGPGAAANSTAAASASAAVETAAAILEPDQAPPLKQLINVEKFKMSDLCKDLPVGTPNEKYDDYENARVQRRRDRLLLLRAKNWKRNVLKREPSEAEKTMLETVYAKFKNERLARSDKIKEESERKLKSLDDSARAGPAAAPTLEIGQDGQIRIEHTQVDRHAHNRSNQSESVQNKVEVDETQKTINSYSFSTKERPERWSKEETQKFYEALSAWGTDFNLIAHLFPTRSRHQIKTKFKYEERRNSIKVQMYLVHRRKANVNSYAEVSDQQIEDVKDIEEALERVRDEHEERMKIEQSAREQARSEDHEKQEQQSPKRRPARNGSAPAPKRERLR